MSQYEQNNMAFDLMNEGGEGLDLFIADEEKDIQEVDKMYSHLLDLDDGTWSTLMKGDSVTAGENIDSSEYIGQAPGFVSSFQESGDMTGRVASLPFGIDSYRVVESEIDEITGNRVYYHRFALDGAPTEVLSNVVNFFTNITGGSETEAVDILEGMMQIKVPISKGMHDRIKSKMESRHQGAVDKAREEGNVVDDLY